MQVYLISGINDFNSWDSVEEDNIPPSFDHDLPISIAAL